MNHCTTADRVTGIRLVAAPLLVVLAWAGRSSLFLVVLGLALASDVVDGFVARRLHQTSAWGARLDSAGDFVTYMTLPICVWRLWPDLFWREAPFIAAVVVCYVAPLVVGFAKFGRLTGYHTWGAKLSSILMAGSIYLMLLGGSDWPFRIGVVVFAFAEIEEIAITATLRACRDDVRSLWHARRMDRELREAELREAGRARTTVTRSLRAREARASG